MTLGSAIGSTTGLGIGDKEQDGREIAEVWETVQAEMRPVAAKTNSEPTIRNAIADNRRALGILHLSFGAESVVMLESPPAAGDPAVERITSDSAPPRAKCDRSSLCANGE